MSNEVTEQAGLVGPSAYTSVVHELEKRILAMMPEHPELVGMTTPWPLFDVDGFDCEDLGPSMAQASAALRGAQLLWKDNMRGARRTPGKRV